MRVGQAGEEYRRRNEAAAVEAIKETEQGDAALYVKSRAAVSQGVALAASEAGEPPRARTTR